MLLLLLLFLIYSVKILENLLVMKMFAVELSRGFDIFN